MSKDTDRELSFQSLTPQDDLFYENHPDYTKNQTYYQALEQACTDPKMKNVALMGNYGSGKSSIIESFIKRFSKEKGQKTDQFICISLAQFKQDDSTKLTNNTTNKIAEAEIELYILQQLFFQVDSRSLPLSKNKRPTQNNYLLSLLFLILSLVSGRVLWQILTLNSFSNIPTSLLFIFTSAIWFSITSILLLIISVVTFSLALSRLSSTFSIKFSIQPFGIEFNNNKHNPDTFSLLTQNIDEIIYFFEQTKKKYVIIEDLDRLSLSNPLGLFQDLRLINTFINNSPKLRQSPVTFIYALRDDIFTDPNHRTKFFDFIIPVVPFIHQSNAADKLREYLPPKHNQFLDSSRFYDCIDTLSPFIPDMRMIKNIANEFMLYRSRFHPKLNSEKMLAIVIYKNLYPKDFSKCLRKEGSLYETMEDLIINKQEKIEKNISPQKQRFYQKVKDLIKVNHPDYNLFPNDWERHISILYPKVSIPLIEIPNQSQNWYSDFLEQIRQNNILFSYQNLTPYILKVSLEEYRDILHIVQSIEFVKNIRNLFYFNDNPLTLDNRSDLKDWSDVMLVMLQDGLIDDDYFDYISINHKQTEISDFLLRLRRNEYSPNATVSPKNIPELIKSIRKLRDRSNEEILLSKGALNFDLFYHIFNTQSYVYDFQSSLVENLKSHSKDYNYSLGEDEEEYDIYSHKIYDFISSYADRYILIEKSNDRLFSFIQEWTGVWDFITKYETSPSKKYSLFKLLVKDIHSVMTPNETDPFVNMFENHKTYLEENFIPIEDSERLQKICDKLQLKFSYTNPFSEEEINLDDYIYQNNHYRIQPRTIATVLQYLGVSQETIDIQYTTSPLSVILEYRDDEPLVKYIRESISEFVQAFYPETTEDNYYSEYEEVLIELLKCKGLSRKQKSNILWLNKTQISTRENLIKLLKPNSVNHYPENKEIIQSLIEKNSITASWELLFTIRALSSNSNKYLGKSEAKSLTAQYTNLHFDYFCTSDIPEMSELFTLYQDMYPIKLIAPFLLDTNIAIEKKVRFFNYHNRYIPNKEDVIKIFDNWESPFSSITKLSTTIEISFIPENEIFVRVLKESRFISSYKIIDTDIKINTFGSESNRKWNHIQ